MSEQASDKRHIQAVVYRNRNGYYYLQTESNPHTGYHKPIYPLQGLEGQYVSLEIRSDLGVLSCQGLVDSDIVERIERQFVLRQGEVDYFFDNLLAPFFNAQVDLTIDLCPEQAKVEPESWRGPVTAEESDSLYHGLMAQLVKGASRPQICRTKVAQEFSDRQRKIISKVDKKRRKSNRNIPETILD